MPFSVAPFIFQADIPDQKIHLHIWGNVILTRTEVRGFGISRSVGLCGGAARTS